VSNDQDSITRASGEAESAGVSAEHLPIPRLPADAPANPVADGVERLFASPFQMTSMQENALIDARREALVEPDRDRQWLTFFLGGEEYAMDIASVSEIIKPREITDIPRVPGFILGIISLRGIVVPVYDLALRLNLGTVDINQQSRIIVCQHEEGLVGLLVDSIAQVVRLNERKIEPPPAMLSGLDREFVSGIGRFQGRMLILLQLHNVLNPEMV